MGNMDILEVSKNKSILFDTVKIIEKTIYADALDICCPPTDFEKKYNVSGISKDWKLPKYFDTNEEWDLATNLFEINFESLDTIVGELVILNPELADLYEIADDYEEGFWNILNGCISKINLDDIIEYVTVGGANETRSKKYHNLQKEVGEKLKVDFYEINSKKNYKWGWVLSLKTLEKLNGKF